MNLLIKDSPLQLLPQLAIKIGDRPAIFLQQLHYWLLKSSHYENGKYWVFNSLENWQKIFPFWSISTIRRIIFNLKEKNLIEIAQLDKNPLNHTQWYTINYEHEMLKYDGKLTEEKNGKNAFPICSKWTNREALNNPSEINYLDRSRFVQNEQIDLSKMSRSKQKNTITIDTKDIYMSNCDLTESKNFENLDLTKLDSALLDNPLLPTDQKLIHYAAFCVLKFLNQETNREYRNSKSNLLPIITQLKSGVTIRECWQIIRRKQREWKGTDYEKYLRIKTLFESRLFEEYLAELRGTKRELEKKLDFDKKI